MVWLRIGFPCQDLLTSWFYLDFCCCCCCCCCCCFPYELIAFVLRLSRFLLWVSMLVCHKVSFSNGFHMFSNNKTLQSSFSTFQIQWFSYVSSFSTIRLWKIGGFHMFSNKKQYSQAFLLFDLPKPEVFICLRTKK